MCGKSKIYLLDTNIVSELSKSKPNENVIKLEKQFHDESCLSVITYFELRSGIYAIKDNARATKLLDFFETNIVNKYEILDYTKTIADINLMIFGKLAITGKKPPIQDSMIAATALAHNMTLVTRNVKDFSNIAEITDLKIENWFLE